MASDYINRRIHGRWSSWRGCRSCFGHHAPSGAAPHGDVGADCSRNQHFRQCPQCHDRLNPPLAGRSGAEANRVSFGGVPAFIGAFIGGFGSERVPEGVLLFLAGLLVTWQGVELLARLRSGSSSPGRQTHGEGLFTRNRSILEGSAGFSIGLLGGAVGLILGSIRLPALIRILRVDPRISAGTNLFIGFIMGSVGGGGHVVQGPGQPPAVGDDGRRAMVGSYCGARLTGKVSLDTLIKTMGCVLLVVGPLLIWQAFRD